jgi:hypothetical protein
MSEVGGVKRYDRYDGCCVGQNYSSTAPVGIVVDIWWRSVPLIPQLDRGKVAPFPSVKTFRAEIPATPPHTKRTRNGKISSQEISKKLDLQL